jgi:ribosomal protein S27E
MGDPGDEEIIMSDVKPEVMCSICGSTIDGDVCKGCGLKVKEEEE